MNLPPYDEGLGAASFTTSQVPPFTFDNVSMRVFPLQADMGRLTSFCDRYLNCTASGKPVPREIAYFRPSVPWVFLMILDYGSMAPVASNMGWVGQSEVVFSVPLEWYQEENGRLVFKDWAYVSPFIFVNEAISMTTGREVYGWAKHLSEYEAGVSPWTKDPVSPRVLMRLSAKTFTHLYSGAEMKPTVLLEIHQDAPPAFSQVPIEAKGPANPLYLMSRAFSRIASQSRVAVEILNGLRMFPSDALNFQGLTGRLSSLRGMASSSAAWNTITFKQFRDEEDPGQACYQALVNSKMTIRRFNRWGFQNDPALALGDLSGGFGVTIHDYETFPVIPTLGLKVARWEERGVTLASGQRVTAGRAGNTYLSDVWTRTARENKTRCARLKPAFPLWMDVHMDYGVGQEICWRERGGDWQLKRESGRAAPGSARKTTKASSAPTPAAPNTPYNTTLGGGLLEALPPLLLGEVSVRVLPLAANPHKLKKFCDNYLNISPHAGYEPYGEYVYLLVWSLGQAISRDNNLGNLKFRIVSFNVPVKWYDRPEDKWYDRPENSHCDRPKTDRQLLTTALAQPFVFADSDLAVATWREVLGIPCVQARVERPPDTWLWEAQSPPERNLMRLSTSAYPALNVGQSAEERTLLEICDGDVLPTETGEFPQAWRFISEHWGGWMKAELERKIAIRREAGDRFDESRDLAMSILAAGAPINMVSIKQFRDAEQPEKACYQSVVRNFLHIDGISNIEEIETPMIVRLHRYASVPIRDLLGIKLKLREMRSSPTPGKVWEGAEVEIAQPIRPFWIQFSGRTQPAEKICWRVENTRWKQTPEAPDEGGRTRFFFLGQPKVGPYLVDYVNGQWSDGGDEIPIRNDWDLDSVLSRHQFADLKSGYKKYKEWFPRFATFFGKDNIYFTAKEAREIAEAVEPQVILESLLNRKVGSWPPSKETAEWTHPWEFYIPLAGGNRNFRDATFLEQDIFWPKGDDEPIQAGRHPDEAKSLYIGSQLKEVLEKKEKAKAEEASARARKAKAEKAAAAAKASKAKAAAPRAKDKKPKTAKAPAKRAPATKTKPRRR